MRRFQEIVSLIKLLKSFPRYLRVVYIIKTPFTVYYHVINDHIIRILHSFRGHKRLLIMLIVHNSNCRNTDHTNPLTVLLGKLIKFFSQHRVSYEHTGGTYPVAQKYVPPPKKLHQ